MGYQLKSRTIEADAAAGTSVGWGLALAVHDT